MIKRTASYLWSFELIKLCVVMWGIGLIGKGIQLLGWISQ